MRIVLALTLLIALASPGMAEIYFGARFERSAGNFLVDTELNSPPSDGWVSVVLSAYTTNNTIAAVKANITGQLHQRWQILGDPELDSTPTGTSKDNGDTHFLTPPTGSTIITFNSEDNNFPHATPWAIAAPDTTERDYGIGSYLDGAWIISPSKRTNSVDFAYVVIPFRPLHAAQTTIRAEIALSDGTGVARDMYLCGGTGDVGLGLCTYEPPEVSVEGNSRLISNNDQVPSLLDGTDFGTVELGSDQVRSFRIRNTGHAPLELLSPTLTGPFSIVGEFPTSVLGNSNQQIQVALNTSTPGTYQGMISFGNNDSNENPYSFKLAANVIPGPTNFAGDFNDDGVVDAQDYTVWRDGLGSLYDQDDYEDWKANFGQTNGGGSIAKAVPEPTSCLLLALGLMIPLRRRR